MKTPNVQPANSEPLLPLLSTIDSWIETIPLASPHLSTDMPVEVKQEIELEIAHVLFIDIVGYSKLSVNEQHARIEELSEIVRLSGQFQKAHAAKRILKIPTGDGMALVFYKSPEEPVQCAFEVGRALKDNPRLQIRMGIHSGPVSGVVDVNERTNVAGAGINLAQCLETRMCPASPQSITCL